MVLLREDNWSEVATGGIESTQFTSLESCTREPFLNLFSTELIPLTRRVGNNLKLLAYNFNKIS
jgi:hypothetical protein